MRKLLLFFAMLCVSIGTWAAPNIGVGDDGTVFLTGFAPNQLYLVLNGGTVEGLIGSVDDLKNATKIYFGDDQGSLTLGEADLAALSNCSATQLDMAKAKLEDGADITKLASTAEYIELPFGTYTKEQFERLKTGNNNLKFAAALTSKGAPDDYAGYSYVPGNLKNFADQGLMSDPDLSKANTVVTLYGKLNSTDLGNINNVLNVHQKVTDISEATVTVTDLTGVSGAMDSDQFLIIPQNISTSWNDEWPNYSLSSTTGYPHFGFYTDANKKKLCVHTGEANATVGNDLAGLYDFVDETMTLSILPDMNSNGSWVTWLNGSNNEDLKNNYLNSLKDLKLGCIDLSWFNLSGLGTNFSKFTNVSHLVLPNNHNNYDFASSQYYFPANIKTVADYTNDADHAGTQFTLDGQYYDLGSTKKATAVYVMQAGSLAEAHQFWPSRMFDIDDYYLAGQIDNDDVAALSNQEEGSGNPQINATTVDMHHAYMNGSALISGYANSAVEYLALPDKQGATINATSATTCAYYPTCPNLKCVASYDIADNKLYTFSTEVGTIKTMTDMIRPKPADRYTGNSCNGLANIVMSGKLNHDDINQTTSTEASQNYGLSSANIVTADLKWAVFPNQDDMCFNTAGGYENLTTIQLPITSQTKLPTNCFNNCTQLNNLCIPGTYEEIGERAFWNCRGLTHVYTNLVSADTGIAADNGNYTITLPPSLKIIRKGAFDNVDFITDVYITTPTTSPAPECEKDAFDATTYWGDDSTFDGGTSWNRVRKTESDGSISAAIAYLHWPKTESEEDDRNKVYTDPTRHYQIKADADVVDDYGDVIYFPSQAEFNRSYIQAIYGYTWKAWPEVYEAWTEDVPGNPYVLRNPVGKNDPEETVRAASDDNYTYDTKYTGWHQFVLSKNIAYTTIIEEPEEFSLDAYKENDWYTICVPFDLTKSEMLEFFGTKASTADQKNYLNGEEVTSDVYPKVVTLVGVERDIDNYTIKLEFSKDFIENNCVWKFTDASSAYGAWEQTAEMADKSQRYESKNGDFVVIEKNKPYFFKPAFSDDLLTKIGTADDPRTCNKTAEDGAEPWRSYAVQAAMPYDMTGSVNQYGNPNTEKGLMALDKDDNPRYTFEEGEGTFWEGGVQVTKKTLTKVMNPDYATSNTNHALYHFVGTYSESQVPAYAYYLGKAKSGKHQFFRHTNGKNRKWSPFSCVIGFFKGWDGADQNDPAFPDADVADDSFIDKSTGEAKAFTFSMSFDEDPYVETTGISEMKASVMANDGKIYTVNGQYVGTSREGLAKGVYVINGKKFIIK